ncbi:T9SS type A sorting domain-containing protein [candidate division GN15 bacterium]|nr:T9SS type A sorting domain-containing protein [candidate division GN15 bacterium]
MSKLLGQSLFRVYLDHRPQTPGECMMIRSLTALLVLLFLSTGIGRAQEPVYLGSIPSDTINSLFGTEIVPLGDQNDDGYADILVWDVRNVAQLYLGAMSPSDASSLRFTGVYTPRSRLGDLDYNGFTQPWSSASRKVDSRSGASAFYVDIGFQRIPSFGDRFEIFNGGPSLDTIPDMWFGVDSLQGWHRMAIQSSDINFNGTSEVITQDYYPGAASIVFYELGMAVDSVPDLIFGPVASLGSCFLFGENLAVGDFNGDGHQDLAASWRSNSNDVRGVALLYWGGPSFDTLPDLVIRRPGGFVSGSNGFGREVLLCPGDLNGDSWDDLIASSSLAYDDTLTFVFYGGPGVDSIPDVVIRQPMDVVSAAGDVNNDGYPDVIASDPVRGFVSLYYGGPDFDSLYDFRIYQSDIPGLHFQFGMHCTGIGDYNGDGIDDFAFSGVNVQSGTVYIYAGFDGSTGNGGGGDVLPVDYELVQNYPNPFNPTTTISFTLPQKAFAELTVYNVLGRKVTTLLSKDLAAGTHTVEWNGTDSHGAAVSSGVYIYRLTAGEAVLSRKMVLAK